MKKKIVYLVLIILSGTFLFYGCGKSSNNPTTNSNAPVASASVTISGFAFSPSVIYLLPGGKVTWTNKDSSTHTVTDAGGKFDSGNLDADNTFSFTFPTTPATYTYHCNIHSMMATATIIVGN